MDRLLVVVFDAESKVYEAKKALHELDREDAITVFDQAVVARNKDGSASVRPGDDLTPVRTLGGTLLGALIGLLGGPVGVGVVAAVGLAAGAAGAGGAVLAVVAAAAVEAAMTSTTARQLRSTGEKSLLRRFKPDRSEMTFCNFINIWEMDSFSRGREDLGITR